MTSNVTTVEFAPGVGIFEVPSSGQWVDITDRMREITTGPLGRDHELRRTQTGTFTVRIDNRDRAFDPGNTAGPYFGQLKPKVQIRVRLDGIGLLYGYIDNYNQTWPSGPMEATKGDAEVDLGCSDAFDIFSSYDLSSYRSVVLGDEPAAYWPLDEPAGSNVAKNYGNNKNTSGNDIAPALAAAGPTVFEIQHIESHAGNATGGTYKIGFRRFAFTVTYTPPLAWNATTSQIQAAIAQAWFGGSNFAITVTGGPNINNGYDISFNQPGDQPEFVIDDSALTGDSVDVSTIQDGGASMIGAVFGFSPGPLASNATTMDFDGTPSNIAISASLIRDGGNLWNANGFEFWIQPRTLTANAGIAAFYEYVTTDTFPLGIAWQIFEAASGAITIRWQASVGVIVSTTSPTGLITTGSWQHIGVVLSSTGCVWYRNGTLFGFSAGIIPKGDTEDILHLARIDLGSTPFDATKTFDGQIAHFAVYNGLDGSRFGAHYLARAEAFDEGDSGAIVSHVLDAIGWPSTARSIDVGSSQIQSIDPSGSALDLMLSVAEDTEGGILQMDGDGNVVFISRHNVALNNALSQATFGDSGSDIRYSELVIDNDYAQNLANIIKATRQNGLEQTIFDQDSIDEVGPRTRPFGGLLLTNDEEVRGFASTQLARFGTPRERPKSFTLLSKYPIETVLDQIKMLTTQGIHVEIKRLPPGGGTSKVLDAQVEGVSYHFQLDGRMWTATYSLVPANVGIWILGISTLGDDTYMGW